VVRPIGIITDYGKKDGYAGALLAEIYKVSPEIPVIEITHEVPPQDLLYGAVVLWQCIRTFPRETIFLVVVDPEVGSTREILIVKRNDQLFVAPDSGVLHFALMDPKSRVYAVDPEFARKGPLKTTTFAGRDLMAPLSARLAVGEITPEAVGRPSEEYMILEIPQPIFDPYRWRGHILHSDRFGNLISDLPAPPDELWATTRVFLEDIPIGPIRRSYSEVQTGSLVATVGALETVEVSVHRGSALERLRKGVGSPIELLFPSEVPSPSFPWW
jgi:S-adenosylmethionine hydrolase